MMIDSHVHIKFDSNIGSGKWDTLTQKDVKEELDRYSLLLTEKNIDNSIMYILDFNWYKNLWLPVVFPKNIIPSLIIDFRSEDISIQINKLKEFGIKLVKFLNYEQSLLREDYPRVLEIARMLERENIAITICCAYGSKLLYDANGIELAAFLLKNGIKAPIILAHGGMVRVFDALALMAECDNVYMDLSFTINYWWGSSLIKDYLFVLRKLNYDRIFYGSDYPFVDKDEAFKMFDKMCKKGKISDDDRNKMLYKNINNFIERFLV